MNNLFRISGIVASINEPVLCKSGSFRTSFVVYGKILSSFESFVCQIFHLGSLEIELGKKYIFTVTPKGIKITDKDTGKERFFNAWIVDSYLED